MPRISTAHLLDRISEGSYKRIKVQGLQNGAFCLLLECDDEMFILENVDGSVKEYPKADYALVWLKRTTMAKEVVVEIEQWKVDGKRK